MPLDVRKLISENCHQIISLELRQNDKAKITRKAYHSGGKASGQLMCVCKGEIELIINSPQRSRVVRERVQLCGKFMLQQHDSKSTLTLMEIGYFLFSPPPIKPTTVPSPRVMQFHYFILSSFVFHLLFLSLSVISSLLFHWKWFARYFCK
jgi:hypothetical protein